MTARSVWLLGMSTAVLFVACGDHEPEQPSPVTSCNYTLGLSSGTFTAAGGTGTATIATGAACSWSATTGADWLSVDVSGQRSGPGTFKYAAASSTSGADRQTSLQVATARATIEQSACSFGLTATTETIANTGGSIALTLAETGSCSWTANADSLWVSAEPASGHGGGQVTLVVAENNTASARTAHVTIGGTTITVAQTGEIACSYSIDPATAQVDFSSGSGHASIHTAAGCEFTVTSTDSWLRSVSDGPLRGSVRVDYEFDAHPTGFFSETRTAALLLHPAAGQGPKLTVEQFPDCHILATIPVIPANGGDVFAQVLADPTFSCPWRALSTTSWLTIPAVNGRGDGGFRLTAKANATGVDRSATIMVGGEQMLVTQQGR